MASSHESARLLTALAALRAEIRVARGDVAALLTLAPRLSLLAAEMADLYERSFALALTTPAAA